MNKTIKYFEDQIYQLDIQLGGILDREYREYLNQKKETITN